MFKTFPKQSQIAVITFVMQYSDLEIFQRGGQLQWRLHTKKCNFFIIVTHSAVVERETIGLNIKSSR